MDEANMKHIVVITTSFPDMAFQAGQEAAGMFVYDFVMELAQRVRVTAVAPSSQDGIEKTANLTVRRFAVPGLPLSLLKLSNPAQWSSIIKTLRSGQHAVFDVTQNDPPDHIFALWALPSGYWAKIAGEKYGIPYSIWALGSDIWSLGKLPLIKNLLRSVLRHSQYRFADGYQLADDVKSLSGLDCAFLPSTRKLPISSEKTLAAAPPYKLAFLGRWHPHKGVDLLLESLQLLDDSDWEKIDSVQICGGGPLERLVYKQCEKLQGNGRPITVRGYLNREKATDLFLWSDYLLLPSHIESIPVIFSDALQTKCPLIASPVGDIPRLMQNHYVGSLASAVTVQAFVVAIRQALQTSPITYQTGMDELAKEFNIKSSVQHLLNCLWEQK
jgi:glycosyltransferase involved in cell wall biosynthesis